MLLHCTGLILFSEHKKNSLAFLLKGQINDSVLGAVLCHRFILYICSNQLKCSSFAIPRRLATAGENMANFAVDRVHIVPSLFDRHPSITASCLPFNSNTFPSAFNVCSIYTGFRNSIAIDLVNVIRFKR